MLLINWIISLSSKADRFITDYYIHMTTDFFLFTLFLSRPLFSFFLAHLSCSLAFLVSFFLSPCLSFSFYFLLFFSTHERFSCELLDFFYFIRYYIILLFYSFPSYIIHFFTHSRLTCIYLLMPLSSIFYFTLISHSLFYFYSYFYFQFHVCYRKLKQTAKTVRKLQKDVKSMLH